MYDRFLKTGDITDAFAAKITELGGDIAKFTEVSGLVKLNSYFAEMVQHFRDTGEILPDLRDLFQQFGGDLSALDKAADLPGLKSSLGFIQDLSDELAKFLPEQTAIQKLMSGTMDQSVIDALSGAGIAPESLTKITGLLKMETGWDDAVKQFQQSGKLLQGGLLEQALLQYGGSASQTAVSRYGQGFNTVTDQLLAGTKAAMDAAFRTERTGILDILKQAAGDITKQVGDITKPIEDQFTVVSTNIQTAFQAAAAAAIAELDKSSPRSKRSRPPPKISCRFREHLPARPCPRSPDRAKPFPHDRGAGNDGRLHRPARRHDFRIRRVCPPGRRGPGAKCPPFRHPRRRMIRRNHVKRVLVCSICLLPLTLLLAAPGRGTVVQTTSGNTVTLAWDANHRAGPCRLQGLLGPQIAPIRQFTGADRRSERESYLHDSRPCERDVVFRRHCLQHGRARERIFERSIDDDRHCASASERPSHLGCPGNRLDLSPSEVRGVT